MSTYSPLIAHIRKYVRLDDREAGLLTDSLQFRSVKKKEFLLKEQEVCQANYFVLKGCLRLYFIQEGSAEQIIQFGIENWWITDQQSLDWQQPSHFYLQAVEATGLAVLDRTATALLFDQVPCLDRYFRQIAQRAFELRRSCFATLLLVPNLRFARLLPSNTGTSSRTFPVRNVIISSPATSPILSSVSPNIWSPPFSASPLNSSARSAAGGHSPSFLNHDYFFLPPAARSLPP